MAGVKPPTSPRRRLAFRYHGRASWARTWDIRFRVAAIALASAVTVSLPAPGLWFILPGVLALLVLARSSVMEVLAVLRGFSGFLLFFFALGLLFNATVSQAVFLGFQALRLCLLLLLGHFLFLAATPTDVTQGIRWYLGFLGRRRAWAVASMAGWALASVPEILEQASTLLEAASLRGLEAKRHPLRTFKLLTLALLVRTVGRSTDLAAALEARGFGQGVPPSTLRARPTDGIALLFVVAWLSLSWVLGAILEP